MKFVAEIGKNFLRVNYVSLPLIGFHLILTNLSLKVHEQAMTSVKRWDLASERNVFPTMHKFFLTIGLNEEDIFIMDSQYQISLTFSLLPTTNFSPHHRWHLLFHHQYPVPHPPPTSPLPSKIKYTYFWKCIVDDNKKVLY